MSQYDWCLYSSLTDSVNLVFSHFLNPENYLSKSQIIGAKFTFFYKLGFGKKHKDILTNEVLEDFVHERLECGQGIGKPKGMT